MPVATRQRNTAPTKSSSVVAGIAAIAKPTTGIKLSIYGRSGTGKTTIFSTFPKPSLLIRAEEGTRSIYKEKGVFTTPLLTDPDQLSQICEHVRGTGKYKTVCLDTATAFQDVVLRSVTQRELSVQLGFAEIGRDEWGQCALRMKEKLQEFLDVADTGCHTLVLAQERDFSEEEASDMILPMVSSRVTPSVVDWLNPSVDYIGHTFIKEVTEKVTVMKGKQKIIKTKTAIRYCMHTAAHPVFVTKFRVPRGTIIPEYLIDPTYDSIAKLID